MAEIKITHDRFGHMRTHIHKRHKTARKELSNREIYLRKKLSRLKRSSGMQDNPEVKEFFDWVWGIQRALNIRNRIFAERLGVSLQTLKLWRNSHGHFPSDNSYRMLLKLERETNILKEELKVVFGEKISVEKTNGYI